MQTKGEGSDKKEAFLRHIMGPTVKISYVNLHTRRVAKDLREELTRSSEASASIILFPKPDIVCLGKNSPLACVTVTAELL